MKPNMPNISVIVCCYGGENTIEECLRSLLNQDLNRELFEVIIVDDGSKDKTSGIIKKFIKSNLKEKHNIFQYYRKTNEGLSIARNFGTEKSSAELVVFIDEDAIAYRNYLSTIVEYFNENRGINCVGGKIELYNDENNFAELIQDSIFSYSIKTNNKTVIGTNMAFRKSILHEAGGFQPEFTYRGDESALFAKAKNKIIIGICDTMRVKHCQPSNAKAWLKTRFENGYFAAAIDILIKKSNWKVLNNIVTRLIFLFVPLLLLLFGLSLIFGSLIFASILLFCIVVYLFRNLIHAWRIIMELRINRNNHTKIKDEIYLYSLVISGIYKESFGYVKGCLAFRNQKWKQ